MIIEFKKPVKAVKNEFKEISQNTEPKTNRQRTWEKR